MKAANDLPDHMLAVSERRSTRATLIHGPDPARLGKIRFEIGLSYGGRLRCMAFYDDHQKAVTAFAKVALAQKNAGWFATPAECYLAMRSVIAETDPFGMEDE